MQVISTVLLRKLSSEWSILTPVMLTMDKKENMARIIIFRAIIQLLASGNNMILFFIIQISRMRIYL